MNSKLHTGRSVVFKSCGFGNIYIAFDLEPEVSIATLERFLDLNTLLNKP